MSDSTFGLDFEIKAIDEAGYIAGVAAGYGNVDYGNDKIMPGALTKAITGRASVPMLLFHDHKRPVGAWKKFDESKDGLLIEGRFAMKSEAGREAHALGGSGGAAGPVDWLQDAEAPLSKARCASSTNWRCTRFRSCRSA
jgi:phage head maturation protease